MPKTGSRSLFRVIRARSGSRFASRPFPGGRSELSRGRERSLASSERAFHEICHPSSDVIQQSREPGVTTPGHPPMGFGCPFDGLVLCRTCLPYFVQAPLMGFKERLSEEAQSVARCSSAPKDSGTVCDAEQLQVLEASPNYPRGLRHMEATETTSRPGAGDCSWPSCCKQRPSWASSPTDVTSAAFRANPGSQTQRAILQGGLRSHSNLVPRVSLGASGASTFNTSDSHDGRCEPSNRLKLTT